GGGPDIRTAAADRISAVIKPGAAGDSHGADVGIGQGDRLRWPGGKGEGVEQQKCTAGLDDFDRVRTGNEARVGVGNKLRLAIGGVATDGRLEDAVEVDVDVAFV